MPNDTASSLETQEGGRKTAAAFRACASCSAPTEFDPATGTLKCPYCSATKDIPRGPVERHAIAEMEQLERPPEQAAKLLKCTNCGAQATLAGTVAATKCAFCASPLAPASNATIPPAEGVVPFEVTKERAGNQFSDWLKGLWFRPSNLKKLGRLREIRGVYVPNWAFDADAASDWSADAGYYYDVQVTEVVNGEERTRTVREIRWEPVFGQHEDSYADLLESASVGLSPKELTGMEPFHLDGKLTAFSGDFLAGFEAESHALRVGECWGHAAERIHTMERDACSRMVPGDTQRNLHVSTTTGNELVRSLLLPVYIAAYEYAGKIYRVTVNGQTGKVTGSAPWSVAKLISFSLAMALVIAGIVYWVQTHK